MSTIKEEEYREKNPEPFIAAMLGSEDDNIIAPQTNRFHLSAARKFLPKEIAEEMAAANTQFARQGEDDQKLEILNDPDLLVQFKNGKGRRIIISEPTYDEATLWRIHDVYRSHGAVARTIDTLVNFVCGRKRTTVILDVNDYFDSDTDEHLVLEEIQNNDLYRKYVRGISKINKKLNMNTHEKFLLTNAMIFGKAALMIEFDQDPNVMDTAMPKALKQLSSLRIGRVFYYEDTYELAGIEYLDLPIESCIIESNRLIYYTNKDYHISPRTLWQGYSALEPILDIAETCILNNQTNIKEINRRLWANFIIVKYMGKRKSDIDKFKKNYKAGMPIISNRDFEVTNIDIQHDLDKLINQQEMSDQKIARDLNLPQILAGFGSHQAQATAGAELHSWLSSTLETRRTDLRNVLEPQWINPTLKRLIILNGDTMESLRLPITQLPDPQDMIIPNPPSEAPTLPTQGGVADTNLNAQPFLLPQQQITPFPLPASMHPQGPPKLTHLPLDHQERKPPIEDIKISNEEVSEGEIVVENLYFKIKYQFTSFAVSTLLDTASTVIGLKKSGIFDMELALTELDRKEYIPHMSQIEKQNQQIFMQMQQGLNPFDPTKGLSDQPAFKTASGRAKRGQAQPQQSQAKGPDAGQRAENIIAAKTNISSKGGGNKTAGSNRTLRTL